MIIGYMVGLLSDYTFRSVILGTMIIGFVSGMFGVFALLRKQSLLGDAIAHASLPGIVGMFLISGSKNIVILLGGGTVAGVIGICLITYITRMTRLKNDAILGIILSVFFGFGLVLLTYLQRFSYTHQGIINKFIFGSAATLMHDDVMIIGIVMILLILILGLCWKQCTLITFDPGYAAVIGYIPYKWELLLNILTVLTIMIGLQTVGVVLMSTMIIAPAAAARQWSNHIGSMVLLAGFFGAMACALGTFISSHYMHMPTGPVIVIVASCLVAVSLMCAPRRGLLWQWYARRNR